MAIQFGTLLADGEELGTNNTIYFALAGDDTIDITAAANVTVHGGLGADNINVLDDTAGVLINGNQDADTIGGGSGADILRGGQGADSIYGGLGADFINGNLGADTVSGGDGNDTLHGGQGADSVSGGEGNDVIYGDIGSDILRGGGGADVFVFNNIATLANTSDTITDFSREEGDKIELGIGVTIDVLTFFSTPGDGFAGFAYSDAGGKTHTVILSGVVGEPEVADFMLG